MENTTDQTKELPQPNDIRGSFAGRTNAIKTFFCDTHLSETCSDSAEGGYRTSYFLPNLDRARPAVPPLPTACQFSFRVPHQLTRAAARTETILQNVNFASSSASLFPTLIFATPKSWYVSMLCVSG